MKELKKRIEEEVLGSPKKIVETDIGDLLVDKVGAKFVHVYNVNRQKKEQYTLKDFAFFALNWQADILEEALREAESYFLLLGKKHEI